MITVVTRDTSQEPARLDAVSRHDLVLAVIPAALLVSLLAGALLSVSPRTALTVGSLVSAVAVFDALFRNPPRSGFQPG